MADARWHDLGPVEELKKRPLAQIKPEGVPIALSYSQGTFGAISGTCNHVSGPLGNGRLESDYACTWPCSITQMDPNDQLDQVYEALVFWSDAVVLSTPIRWGSASALYYKWWSG